METVRPLDKEIHFYLNHLNTQQKQAVLTVVKTLARDEDEWWSDVEDAAGESVKKGLQQAKAGLTTPHKEVMKKYKKWLSKQVGQTKPETHTKRTFDTC